MECVHGWEHMVFLQVHLGGELQAHRSAEQTQAALLRQMHFLASRACTCERRELDHQGLSRIWSHLHSTQCANALLASRCMHL